MILQLDLSEQVIADALTRYWRELFDAAGGRYPSEALRLLRDQVSTVATGPEAQALMLAEIRRAMPSAIRDAVAVAVADEVRRQIARLRKSGALREQVAQLSLEDAP